MSAGILAALALYPLLVYFGLRHFGAIWIAAVLLIVCALRFAALRWSGAPAGGAAQVWLLCGGGIALAVTSILRGSADAILYYPVVMNAVLLFIFAHSVAYPPTVVERIARLRTPDLPPAGVRYTRNVTIAWAAFFVCNGAIALYTVLFASFGTWALYNGAIAYALIGAMFAAELLTRTLLRNRLRA
ncbi:MAG TPA: hypothetical protein VFX89_04810 [Gammaproteobacteria bacterium]|nr:hypothetical protein [Gammaproteobacteria bacterium]